MSVLAVFGVTLVTLVMGTALMGWREMTVELWKSDQDHVDREFAAIVAHWDD